MGSCISKCKPNRKKENSTKKQPVEQQEEEEEEEKIHVKLQDKLVIAASENNPPLKSPLPPQKTLNPNLPLSPISPSHSSCSSSSFSCTTNCHNSSSSSSSSSSNPCLSSASSSASSVLNPSELLQSCLKQNPQIVLLDPTKKPSGAPPQKRQRASSPNLTRQKSFRRDPVVVGPTLLNQPKKPSPLRSPSPNRRFVTHKEHMKNSKVNTINNVKKESFMGLSDPNSRSRRSIRPIRTPSMRKEAEICSLNRVVSRVNGIAIGNHLEDKDVEMLPVEDLNNPHIALDCFIFL